MYPIIDPREGFDEVAPSLSPDAKRARGEGCSTDPVDTMDTMEVDLN